MLLSKRQMELAAHIGNLRTASGRDSGRKDYLSCDRAIAGDSDVQAAVAECAMALKTGFPWRAYKSSSEHKGRCKELEPDVGPIEIKSISKPHHQIILHSHPIMNAPHVSLLVKGNEVTFMGWAFGFEIWNEKHWDESLPTPAYARRKLYGIRSLWNWLEQSGWKIKEVDYPRFEKGWEPA